MNNEQNKLLRELANRKVNKEQARKTLIGAGLITEDGEISDNYSNIKRIIKNKGNG